MFFKHFYDPDLAQGSYLIGCQATGDAIVVDARRDVDAYLREAEAQGLTITDVTETHIHADYLSGSRELAQRTGARLWLSDMGDADWKYHFDGRLLTDGDEIQVGNVIVRAVHTPGHTPEHLSFLVIDGATTTEPQMILTGDFVFVGDIGRPDLLDEAAGGVDTRFGGAKQLFASLRDRFLTLPDYVQVWPAHGAGSACGKSLGAVPASTVGYERTTAWWADYVANGDEEGFTRALLEGQPDAPLYFGRMKRWNKEGPALLGERTEPVELDAATTARRLNDREILFLDTRTMAEWHEDAIDGALFVPYGSNFATYASYAIDPERDTQEIVVLAADAQQAEVMRDKLAWTGIDNFGGFVTGLAPFERERIEILTPAELEQADDVTVLDVRTASEYDAGHIDDAMQIHAGRVRWTLERVPEDGRLVVHCQSGGRSAVAASILRRHGVENVAELQNSYEGWVAYRQPQDAAPA
jgi:hydroxyacylglutathione hydrolase